MAGTPVKTSYYDPSSAPPRLLTLLQRSKFGVAIFNRSLHFVGVNPAIAAMNGVPAAAHPGRKISDVLGKAAALTVAPLIESVFATGRPVSGFEWSAKLPARAEIGHWVADYLPLFDQRTKVRHVAALVWELRVWKQRFNHPSHVQTRGRIGDQELSPREMEIARLLAEGKCNKEVSSVLNISIKTVESHRSRVLLKLHLDSLVALVHYAIRTHLVEP